MNGEATAFQLFLATITIFGSGRLGPTIAAVMGLTGAVIGALTVARSKRRAHDTTDMRSADGRGRAAAAVALGVTSLLLGGLFLAAADGGPGTGNGVVGSAAAIVLGPIAIILGGVANARRRQAASSARTMA